MRKLVVKLNWLSALFISRCWFLWIDELTFGLINEILLLIALANRENSNEISFSGEYNTFQDSIQFIGMLSLHFLLKMMRIN